MQPHLGLNGSRISSESKSAGTATAFCRLSGCSRRRRVTDGPIVTSHLRSSKFWREPMCMIEDADGSCQVLQDQTRKARKEHRCSECSRIIRAGEDYRYEVTLYDGSCNTHKTCSHCQVSRAWLSDNCGGWVYGAVEEDIAEHARDYRRKDIIRLKFG